MDFIIGQRWRWTYSAGVGSDLILEVIGFDMFKTVSIIKGWGSEDYIGRTFSARDLRHGTSCSKLEYLEGQDKPL